MVGSPAPPAPWNSEFYSIGVKCRCFPISLGSASVCVCLRLKMADFLKTLRLPAGILEGLSAGFLACLPAEAKGGGGSAFNREQGFMLSTLYKHDF